MAYPQGLLNKNISKKVRLNYLEVDRPLLISARLVAVIYYKYNFCKSECLTCLNSQNHWGTRAQSQRKVSEDPTMASRESVGDFYVKLISDNDEDSLLMSSTQLFQIPSVATVLHFYDGS